MQKATASMKLIFPADKLTMDMIKKSYWIQREHLFDPVEYICSVCGAASEEPWEECPVCGAKMKKIKYDPVYVDEAEMLDIILEDD